MVSPVVVLSAEDPTSSLNPSDPSYRSVKEFFLLSPSQGSDYAVVATIRIAVKPQQVTIQQM